MVLRYRLDSYLFFYFIYLFLNTGTVILLIILYVDIIAVPVVNIWHGVVLIRRVILRNCLSAPSVWILHTPNASPYRER
jgi:hypothetical protein